MVKIFLFLFLIISLSHSADQCSSGYSSTLNGSNLSYSRNNGTLTGPTSSNDTYYINVAVPGTVSVTVTGANVRFSYSETVCPATGGGLTSSTYTFTAATDFNLRVYRLSAGPPTSYTITVSLTPSTPPSPVLPRADWRLDECAWNGSASEVLDSSGNSYHGRSVSSDTSTDGQVCRSGDFSSNGTGDYAILNNSALNGLDDFTMSVWLKSSNTGNQAVISGANSARANEALMWFSNGTTFTPFVKNRSRNISITNIANDQWHHFVWTRSGLESCAYVDGVLQGCQTINNSSGAVQIDNGGLILAQEQDSVGGGFNPSQDFEGLIDEVKIYSSRLSTTQVQDIYNNENSQKNYDGSARTCTACTTLPVADYHFDECSWDGTVDEVLDSSGSAFHGRSQNGTNTVIEAQLGRSGYFDGVDDYVEQTDIYDVLKTTSSLSFWIKTTQSGDDTSWRAPGIIGIEEAGGGDDIFWGWIDASGHIGVTKGNTNTIKSTTVINDDSWHHIVLTWNAVTGQGNVYVDNVLEDTGITETGDVGNNFSRIGSIQDTGGTPSFFNGYLDEVIVFSSVLTASQIQDIYTNQFSGNNYDGSIRVPIDCSTRLLAEYKMDECLWDGSADEVVDSSGNDYHAKAKNGALVEPAATSGGGICSGGKFDGVNDYLEIGVFPDVIDDFSITAWFKTEDRTEPGQRVFADDETSTNGYAISVGDGGAGRVRFYDRSQTNNGIIDTPVIVQNNTWYFVTAVNDKVNAIRHLYVYNTAGTQLAHVTRAIDGIRGSNTGLASIGGETDSGEINNRFRGNIDEVKVFTKALSQSDLEDILNNERVGVNWDGTGRTCPGCGGGTPKDGNYNAVDLVSAGCNAQTHWTDTIKTKIVNETINFSVLAKDSATDLPMEANITKITLVHYATGDNSACSGATLASVDVCTNCGLTDADGCLTTSISNIFNARASKCVEVLIEGKDKDDTAGVSLSESNASDNFAIRPDTYSCDGIPASVLVAEGSNLSDFKATPLSLNSATVGYTTSSVLLTANRYMRTGDLNSTLNGAVSPASINFTDGNASGIDLRFSDVGDIGIDLNDSTWANVDSDDTIEADRVVYAECRRLFRPDHFKVELARPLLEDNATGFTYLSNLAADVNMSAWVRNLSVTITAEGENNGTMLNYFDPDTQFYANDITLSPVLSLPAKHSNAVKRIDLVDENRSDIGTLNFVNGVAVYSYDDVGFNYDRSYSNPIIPFVVDGSESYFTLDVQDRLYPSVVGSDSTDSDGNTTFYYGRLRGNDIGTTLSVVSNPVLFEVYDNLNTPYTSGMKQTSLFWFINSMHTGDNPGDIIEATASSNMIIDNVLAGFGFTYTPVSAGIEALGVTSGTNKKAVIHLKTQEWLWYAPSGFGSAYDDTAGSDCTMHPCFNYTFTTANGGLMIQSGDFNGTIVPDQNRSDYQKKGVKVFR